MIAFLLAQTIAITGGTVYPVAGPKLAKATVLIRDGRIAAVGTDVSVPSDATRIDAAGKWVTPGLIDGAGQVGLVEISAVPGTREGSIQGDTIAAAFNVAEGINPASTLIPVTRIEGITTALAVPAGNLVSGQAVLIDLDGATIEQMLVKSPVGVVADLSESGKDDAGGSRARIAERLRQVFRDALEYERRKADFRRAQMQHLSASDEDLEALLPMLHGQVALIAQANRRSDIETALRLAREFRLKLIVRERRDPRARRREGRAARDGHPQDAQPAAAGRQRRIVRDDVGPGAARRDAGSCRDLRRGRSVWLAGAGQGGERRGLVRRSVRVHDRRGARVHPGQGDCAEEPADGTAGEVPKTSAYVLGRQRAVMDGNGR